MGDCLAKAKAYAKAYQWRIFPCGKDKKPLIKEWQKRATSDIAQIEEWWKQHPNASIGMACGKDSKVWVLDVDLPEGPEVLSALQKANGGFPLTLQQKTGGGGLQIFWAWNGKQIRNSASKIGKNLDVRGEGGYVILPPSPHPSGGTYQWTQKVIPVVAPRWLTDLLEKQEPAPRVSHGSTSPYGEAALLRELSELARAGEGQRNDSLNRAAFNLGQLVAGGELGEGQAESALIGTAYSIGLTGKEIQATIRSGISDGKCHPRNGDRYNDPVTPVTSVTSVTSVTPVTECNVLGDSVTFCNAPVTPVTPFGAEEDHSAVGNFTAQLTEFVENSCGSFTTSDIDREFGIVTQNDRTRRRVALHRLINKKIIIKDRRMAGRYLINTATLDFIDLNQTEEKIFPINFPLELHSMVSIPPKCIVVVAGSSNAGKTAFLLETLRLNLKPQFEKLYLMSEMGPSEYKQRVSAYGQESLPLWNEKVKASSVSSGFHAAVSQYNPNGLTVIDFLEEVEGEYYRIASDIRAIYDALESGVAIVALQKHSNARVGRGGEATTEKARLYITIDQLLQTSDCAISAVKIVKAKNYTGKNPNGKERHIRIVRGATIEPLSDWMYCDDAKREYFVRQYEKQYGDDNNPYASHGEVPL